MKVKIVGSICEKHSNRNLILGRKFKNPRPGKETGERKMRRRKEVKEEELEGGGGRDRAEEDKKN